MKKNLIYFAILSIALLSCKKENHTKTTESQGNLHPVTFNISNFTQQIGPINETVKTKINAVVPPEQSNIVKLQYKLYDSSNTLKKTVTIYKGEPAFGAIQDSLASGNYTAVFVGATDLSKFEDDGTTFSYGNNLFLETFYKKINFVVGNKPLTQDVILQRLTSEVQVVIKDAIPTGITVIDVQVYNLNNMYSYFDDASSDKNISPGSILTRGQATNIPADKIGTTNFSLDPVGPLLNTISPVTVYVTAQNGTNVIARKTISNITLRRNTRTILTGNLFSNSSDTNGFTLTFNSAYNPNDINKGF
jgi:hypothetical protein